MASSDSPTSLLERVHDFVSENKRAILVGTAAAAIAFGGVAYYASTSSRFRGRGDGDLEKGRKKKSNKGEKKKKTVKDPNGPILEERERPAAKVEDEGELDRQLFY